MERGFSLSEVLVSLLLVVSLSLVLLKQQWQLHRIVNQTKLQAQSWLETSNDHERGMSLVELMVALTLALSLITLVMQLYSATFQQFLETQTTLNQSSRLQLSLTFMRSVIKQAGFTPCLPIGALQTLSPNQHQPLQALALNPNDASVITTYRMGDSFMGVARIVSPHQLTIAKDYPISLQGPLLLADCHHAEVISDFTQHNTTLRLGQSLAFSYYPPVYIGEWQTVAFGLKANRLYYNHKHRETLLSDVRALIWHIVPTSGHTMVHGDVRLNESSTYPIDIRLRNVA